MPCDLIVISPWQPKSGSRTLIELVKAEVDGHDEREEKVAEKRASQRITGKTGRTKKSRGNDCLKNVQNGGLWRK